MEQLNMSLVHEEELKNVPTILAHTANIRVAELFAGTGAFTRAFENAGARAVFANDFCRSSKEFYEANFTSPFVLQDVHELDVEKMPDFDVLTAGFPCQPFSIAGEQKGFDDSRSNVFWKMLEIIRTKKPRCLLLENVSNLLSHDEGKTFETIRSSIAELGYTVDYKVLDTCVVTDVPHHRKRLYIICFDKPVNFEWPSALNPTRSFREFLDPEVPEKYYYGPQSAILPKLEEEVVSKESVYQYRRYYVRENKNGVCPTLTANMGTGGHNVPIILDDKGIRKLTPNECFKLQGFSEYNRPPLSDAALYKLAGNAVSVGVVNLLAKEVVNVCSVGGEAVTPVQDYSQMNVAQLKTICRNNKLKKKDLVDLITTLNPPH
jgi:DNA (cytosine-5)-methyltransferase 1